MSGNKIMFGVIGVGRIGKIHIENLVNQITDAQVLALTDLSQKNLDDVAEKYGISQCVPGYMDILENKEIDAIVICSPTDTHFDIILNAADAGKQIFCEKPVDLSIEKIQTIKDKIQETGIKFMVGFNRRFDPNFVKVRELVSSGKVGEPHIVKITSRDPGPPPEQYIRSSGGLFLDMTIHDFDMARYLINSDVVSVFAQGRVKVDPVFEAAGDIDTAVIVLNYENGAMAVIDNSRKAVYGYDQRVEVFGSQGMAAVKNNTPDNHYFWDSTGMHSSLPLNFFVDRYTQSYLTEMQIFIECLRNNSEPPVSCDDGLKATAIALAANKSMQENRPVNLSEII